MGSVQTITLVGCQVGLRFSADREILDRLFESVGPSMIREYVLLCSPTTNPDSVSCQTEPCVSQRMTPRMKSAVGPSGAPSIVSLPNDKSRKDSVMNRRKLIALSAVFVTAVAAFLISFQTPLPSAPKAGRDRHRLT